MVARLGGSPEDTVHSVKFSRRYAWIRQRTQQNAPEIAARALAMADVIEQAQQVTKRMSRGLRPRVLDDLGRVSAKRALVDGFAQRHGVECELQISDDGEVILDQRHRFIARRKKRLATSPDMCR